MIRHLLSVLPRDRYDQLVMGLSEYDPCAKVLKKFRGRYIVNANYYLVTKDLEMVEGNRGKRFYLELARV